MGIAADLMAVIQTPAYKACLARLLAAGTWVARADLDGCAASRFAIDDALADLVMTGWATSASRSVFRLNVWATYRPEAGYRIARPALQRLACRHLVADPALQRAVQMRQTRAGVHMAVAQRLGPEPTDIAAITVLLPAMPDATDADALTHAASVLGRADQLIAQE